MTPPIRSRMWASGIAFATGFVLANYGILMVPSPDRVVWLVAAGVMMLTGALGVLFADSVRRFSIWVIVGIEALIGFTLIPVGWLWTLAVSPTNSPVTSWLPQDWTIDHFGDVWDSPTFRAAAADTAIVAATATAVSLIVGGCAAYTLATTAVRGKRAIYALVLASLFLPLVTIVGPVADQSLAFGLYDSRSALMFAYLALTLPLSIWLLGRLFARMPWRLLDAARADGATRIQRIGRIWLPLVAPGLLAVAGIVFFAAWNFLLFGLGISATGRTATVPSALQAIGDASESAPAAMAATTLLWFIPVLIFVLMFQRRITMVLASGKA